MATKKPEKVKPEAEPLPVAEAALPVLVPHILRCGACNSHGLTLVMYPSGAILCASCGGFRVENLT